MWLSIGFEKDKRRMGGFTKFKDMKKDGKKYFKT